MSCIAASRRLGRIKPSASVVACDRARRLQAEGRDIVDLTAGDQDFDAPLLIVQAAAYAMVRGDGGSYRPSPRARLSIAASPPMLEDACDGIARACAALR